MSAARDALLRWYVLAARDLPWRRTRDPYRIWVSEVMLQQTQVETVRPYYQRFLDRFPDLATLAAAPLDEVLVLWQGLGYYRRARSLHAAARIVVAQHGGELPHSAAALRELPGIGDYTAAAIASIAWGEVVAVVDGNVERVLTRWAAIEGDPRHGAARRRVRELATSWLPPDRPGDLNQALMELGATLCRPTMPSCVDCPLRPTCRAFARGDVDRFPERVAAAPPRRKVHAVAVLRQGPKVLLAQRPADGRWGGLWELPRVECELSADVPEELAAGLQQALGVRVEVGEVLASLKHAVSGEAIELRAYAAELVAGEPSLVGYQVIGWFDLPADGLALSTPQRRLLAKLRAGEG